MSTFLLEILITSESDEPEPKVILELSGSSFISFIINEKLASVDSSLTVKDCPSPAIRINSKLSDHRLSEESNFKVTSFPLLLKYTEP